MADVYTKAKFWKCALQVNSVKYIACRGTSHGLSEDEYNKALVQVALENNIKVIGLADHGNVEDIEPIRELMRVEGILVFPGFEIASSEKIHFVCLYCDTKTTTELNRCLGNLDLLDPKDGIRPSRLSAETLIQKIEEHGAFIYAAHCTGDSGLLQKRLQHIWTNPLLKAVQIPGTIDDLKKCPDTFYYQVISNKNADYKREFPIAVINAKDVEIPQTLAEPAASCLIKMTKPSFQAFKEAFQDPESRVRLNSDKEVKYYSQIQQIQITGGYLDGLNIEFSEHLNTIIGGRGTGKSTLLECIRYALGKRPISKNAQKQHDEIVKENLGKNRARVELTIRSSKMHGQYFTIARRYGENIFVQDEQGKPSSFQPDDLLPGIEIFGQNEIYEITQEKKDQRKLLERFLELGHAETESAIVQAEKSLADNRKKIIKTKNDIALVEDEVTRLPKLNEQIEQFKKLGIEDKLKTIPLLEKTKQILNRAEKEEGTNLEVAIKSIQDNLPDTIFLSEQAIDILPHAAIFRQIRAELNSLKADTSIILSRWQEIYNVRQQKIISLASQIHDGIKIEENILELLFKELPSCEGKSGHEIGLEYQKILKEIELILPKKNSLATHKKLYDILMKERQAIHQVLSAKRAERSALLQRTLKRLNKRLSGHLKLDVTTEANRQSITDFLQKCHLEGVGTARLAWINDATDFSPLKLAALIQQGADALKAAKWGMTPTVAEALSRMSLEHVLQLEEIELTDEIKIELNISHSNEESYRSLDKLSTGQQCTAILHLLLLDNKDPLLMDQPEDNLDNAFIAERIVTELRKSKINRQFIFATHNANIPVFGDAEWIGVFEANEGTGIMPITSQGAIDSPEIKAFAATILEGGKTAFNQRKVKYGY